MIDATFARPRILVVEDDPEQSEQMERTLFDLGYDVVDRARSGLSGVQAARRHHPDLVLMDVRLPGAIDGVGAARAICETDDIPMVFVTGASGGEELRRIISSTPHGYVVKPFGRGQLEAAVELGLQRWRSERTRKEREEWLERMLRCHEDVVVVLDASGTVEYISPSVEALLGLPPERHLGRDFLERGHPEDRSRVRQAMEAVIRGSAERLRVETRFRKVGGGWRHLRLEGGLYRPGASGHDEGAPVERVRLVVRARDVTRGRARERKLERMAYEDPLTGLMNRRAFDNHAARYLALAERRRTHLGVIYLDLVGFKAINDGFGHEAGDEVLAAVARRLEAGARGSDMVCRMGGDEFVVLLPEVDGRRAAMDVAHRLDCELREPIAAAGSSLKVRAAMGVAVYPDDGSSMDALLRSADRALYGAKEGRVESRVAGRYRYRG